jgi:hypothetical protein
MKFIQVLHHNRPVWANLEHVTRHKEHCLCYSCERFNPNSDTNCPIAQEVFELNKKLGITTPVWECPDFLESEPQY